MNETVIEVKDLCRSFKATKGFINKKKEIVEAVKGISFSVNKGEIFGLLGPNGAGKTTTIKMLTTLLAPTSGMCKVLNYNSFGEEKYIRGKINFIFGGENGVYRRLSGRDNLVYFSNLYKIPPKKQKIIIPELLELVGLTNKADLRVETYSKGMIQRLQVARGLINDPEIVFMDEPTIGLDPVGARDLRNIIKTLSKQGKTILLTTHYMYEADELCDRIAIINHGEIVVVDTPENLKKKIDKGTIIDVYINENPTIDLDKIRSIPHIVKVDLEHKNENSVLKVICHEDSDNMVGKILNQLNDVNILRVDITEPSLEDVYIKLVGGKK